MDSAAARRVLGVSADASWLDVRAAYLRLVRAHHPDGAADEADAVVRTLRTAQLTRAYAALAAATASGSDPAGATPRVAASSGRDALDETRRVLLDAEIADAFTALLEAAYVIGSVSYVDRQSAVLETIVTAAPGEATSLLIYLEPGEGGITEAIMGVEPLGRHPPAALDSLVERVAALLAAPCPPFPGGGDA